MEFFKSIEVVIASLLVLIPLATKLVISALESIARVRGLNVNSGIAAYNYKNAIVDRVKNEALQCAIKEQVQYAKDRYSNPNMTDKEAKTMDIRRKRVKEYLMSQHGLTEESADAVVTEVVLSNKPALHQVSIQSTQMRKQWHDHLDNNGGKEQPEILTPLKSDKYREKMSKQGKKRT